MDKPKSACKFSFKLIIPSAKKITKPASVRKEEISHPIIDPVDFSDVDTETLQKMTDKLWAKFIVFFDLEDTFKYNPIYRKDDSVRKCKAADTTFENRFKVYLQIYNIKRNENQILVSYNKEGSYILKNSKIWIIHMKILINDYKYSLLDLIPLINIAFNNGCDAKIIFDFFIMEMLKLEEDLINSIVEKFEDVNEDSFPKEFMKLWNKRKENIHKEIQKSNEKKERERTPFKASKIDSVSEEEEFSFRMNDKEKEEPTKKNIDKDKNKENMNEKELEKNKQLTKTCPVKKKKKEYYKNFNYATDLKDAKLISNEKIEKVKNYKVLELNPKVQDNVGLKYVVTPLKEKPIRQEVNEDLKVLNEALGDYYYQPYKKEIISKIESDISSDANNKKNDK